ncbi:unnamed protein product [Ilex paraguariensis]|uniref:Uncharacterized protein n=1 Tax=Ilex paraguariensis TaxID=185542 RepID=A0ABC8TW62_9AQUA
MNGGEEVLTFLDRKLDGNADVEELARACKVACWCIQDDEKDRPTMGQVVMILEGVLEVGLHPTPRFLQGFAFADNTMENIVTKRIFLPQPYFHELILSFE